MQSWRKLFWLKSNCVKFENNPPENMSKNFRYIYLGEPPNQPRKSNFVPKRGKVGLATVVDIDCLESDRLIAGNLETLKKYDIKDSSDLEEFSIKAGQVIIAAEPFVYAPATG